MNIEKLKNEYTTYALLQKYDNSYIDKVLSSIGVEIKLRNQKISQCLKYTKVLLFKAMLQDNQFTNYEDLHQYSISLEYNNIEKVLVGGSNIEVVKVIDSNHGNILSKKILIVKEILKFYINNLL
jgi:hypothetical protein